MADRNFIYIAECSDGSWYTGWTTDLQRRIRVHNSGRGARYTKSRRPVKLIYWEEYPTEKQARSREYEIKQLSRQEKEKLVRAAAGKGKEMSVEQFFDKVLSVRLTEDRRALDIIDQTLLPGTIRRIRLETKEEIWEAIKKLRVRGAPAIGVTAAYGMAVLSEQFEETSFDTFYERFKALKEYLASSRPTAVNLFWALNRMDETALSNREKGVAKVKELLYAEAEAIREEDVAISRNIGEIGGNPGDRKVRDRYGAHVHRSGTGLGRNGHACLLR